MINYIKIPPEVGGIFIKLIIFFNLIYDKKL